MAKPKMIVNANDIAAANLGFMLVQMLIQQLLNAGVIDRADVLKTMRSMADSYKLPGRTDRAPIRAAAAEVLEGILLQLEPNAGDRRH